MSDDKSNVPSLEQLKPLVRSLVMRIKNFERLEIQPHRLIGYGRRGEEITWPCEPELATCWIVYGVCQTYGSPDSYDHFTSLHTEAAALTFCDKVMGMFPHLRGRCSVAI